MLNETFSVIFKHRDAAGNEKNLLCAFFLKNFGHSARHGAWGASWAFSLIGIALKNTWFAPFYDNTLFENYRKSLMTLQAMFTFWMDKSSLKMAKLSILASFWKSAACGQTALPDRSTLIRQKLVENAKIQKFKCDK